MLGLVERALQELSLFRRSDEVDATNAVAVADCLEKILLDLAGGDPEVADLVDQYLERK